jgi:hypothetical protein
MIYQQVFSCVPNDHIHSRLGMWNLSPSFSSIVEETLCSMVDQHPAGTNFGKALLIGRRRMAIRPSTWVLH